MREDMEAIPIMEAAGWTTVYSSKDKKLDLVHRPSDTVEFKKGNAIVRKCYRGYEEDYESYWIYGEITESPELQNYKEITLEEASKL